jgi:hypothetical protein
LCVLVVLVVLGFDFWDLDWAFTENRPQLQRQTTKDLPKHRIQTTEFNFSTESRADSAPINSTISPSSLAPSTRPSTRLLKLPTDSNYGFRLFPQKVVPTHTTRQSKSRLRFRSRFFRIFGCAFTYLAGRKEGILRILRIKFCSESNA